MVPYLSIFNEKNPHHFFVFNKFTIVPFTRSFNKINPQWYFLSAFSMKSIHTFSLLYINSPPYLLSEVQQIKSQVILSFSIFNELNRQFFFVLSKFTAVPFIKSFNKLNLQWYFLWAFSMKLIHTSSLF